MRRLVLLVGIAVVVLGVGAAAMPTSSQAFIGEPLVVNPVTKALTPAAERVVKRPSFIPEVVAKAGAAGTAADASATLAVAQGAGLFPTLGAVLGGFGVGALIGSEICNSVLGLDGCWFVESEGPDPVVQGQYHWNYITKPVTCRLNPAVIAPAYNFYAGSGSASVSCTGFEPVDSSKCKQQPPAGVTSVIFAEPSTCFVAGEEPSAFAVAQRNQLANRQIGWHASDTPMPNFTGSGYCPVGGGCSTSPAPDWATRMGELLQDPSPLGITQTQADKLGQGIAHEISPATVADPYAVMVVVPNCGGLTYEQCAAKLEAEGLEPVKNTLGWQTADLSVGADLVVGLQPDTLTQVEKGTAVTVTVNPPKEGMPIVIPAIQPGETYEEYAGRLDPRLEPERVQLPDYATDPKAGPNAAVRVAPEPGSRVPPDSPTTVRVWTNPPTAPPPGGGGDCDASVGEIDFGPLNKPLGDKFPFGVVSFFAGWIGEWGFSSEPPKWSVTFLPAGVFGSEEGVSADVDFGALAPVFDVVRVAFMFASFVGLLWFLGTAAMKLQGDDS